MQPVMPRLLLYVCTKKVDRKAGGIRRRPGHRRAQAGRWSSPVNTPQIQRNTRSSEGAQVLNDLFFLFFCGDCELLYCTDVQIPRSLQTRLNHLVLE
jgi:hypothetical protein